MHCRLSSQFITAFLLRTDSKSRRADGEQHYLSAQLRRAAPLLNRLERVTVLVMDIVEHWNISPTQLAALLHTADTIIGKDCVTELRALHYRRAGDGWRVLNIVAARELRPYHVKFAPAVWCFGKSFGGYNSTQVLNSMEERLSRGEITRFDIMGQWGIQLSELTPNVQAAAINYLQACPRA